MASVAVLVNLTPLLNRERRLIATSSFHLHIVHALDIRIQYVLRQCVSGDELRGLAHAAVKVARVGSAKMQKSPLTYEYI